MFNLVSKMFSRSTRWTSHKSNGKNKRQARLLVEFLEDRTLMSTLAIDAGLNAVYNTSSTNALSITIDNTAKTPSVTITDSENITLSGAGSGQYSGNGTHTVTGPLTASISISDSTTTVNVNDTADYSPQTLTFTAFHPLLSPVIGSDFASVEGLAAGVITMPAGGTNALTVSTTPDDTINVLSTVVPTTINVGVNTRVNVGNNGSVQGITKALTLNQGGLSTLDVNDAADTTARTPALNAGSITGLAPGAITYNAVGFDEVLVTTGTAANQINVQSTQAGDAPEPGTVLSFNYSEILTTSGGGNTITITGVALYSDVYVVSSGSDTVNIGSQTSAYGAIMGVVQVENTSSLTALSLDDSNLSAATPVTLSNTSTPGLEQVTGLFAGTIQYYGAEMSNLSVTVMPPFGGAGPTIDVMSTATATTLHLDNADANAAGSPVFVGDTSPGAPGTVQGILTPLTIIEANADQLTLDDSNDAGARVVTLSEGSSGGLPCGVVSGLAPATIAWANGSLRGDVGTASAAGLVIDAGTGNDCFTIDNPGVTPPISTGGPSLSLNNTKGTDAINLQATAQIVFLNNTMWGTDNIVLGSTAPTTGGVVANINGGGIFIAGPAGIGTGTTNLLIDDSGDINPTCACVTFTSGQANLACLAPANIFWTGVNTTTIDFGPGNANFAIVNPSPQTLILNGGVGLNTLTGPLANVNFNNFVYLGPITTTTTATSVTVQGTVETMPVAATVMLDFSYTAGGQQVLLGAESVTLNSQGDATFDFTFDVAVPASAQITVTLAAPSTLASHLPTVAYALTHSYECYYNFVVNAYQQYLGRMPSLSEANGWVTDMQNGLSDEHVEAGFIGSPEYITNHGGPGAGWVTGMYQNLLGRTPSQAEVDGWVQALNSGMSTTAVAYGFAASVEREGDRVTADYEKYLGRAPSQAEVSGWVDAFEAGQSNEDVIAGFVGSPEYFSDHGSTVAAWLDAAYTDVLGRPADVAAYNTWLPVLE